MGGVLSVINDHPDFQILQANIFTPSQGICLQRLEPKNSQSFKFDNGLAYGSWYDVQIIGKVSTHDDNNDETIKYLAKDIYLTIEKIVKISELTNEEYRDYGAKWKCSNNGCQKENFGSVSICEYCFENKSQIIMQRLSYMPIIGLPFSITNAVLQSGKASQSNTTADKIDAAVTVISAAIDVITAPFIIGALAKIPAKVAAETGVKVTAKTVFCEVGKEMTKGGIVVGSKLAKDFIKVVLKELANK